MIDDLKFIAWKVAEGCLFLAGFPFLFVGAWIMGASAWCRERAEPHTPRSF